MHKVFFVVTSCADEQPKLTWVFKLAKSAAVRDSLVGIALVNDSVYLARPEILQGIRSLGNETVASCLDWFKANVKNSKFMASASCCKDRGLAVNELDDFWVMASEEDILDCITQANARVVTF